MQRGKKNLKREREESERTEGGREEVMEQGMKRGGWKIGLGRIERGSEGTRERGMEREGEWGEGGRRGTENEYSEIGRRGNQSSLIIDDQ